MIKTCQVVKARRRGSLQIQLDSASIAQVILQIIIVMILKITVTMASRDNHGCFSSLPQGVKVCQKRKILPNCRWKIIKIQSCPKLAVKLFSSIRPRSDRIWHFATEWGCQRESIGNVDDDDPRSGIGLVLITDVTEQRLEYPSLGAGLRSNSGLASGSGLGHRSRITDSYRSNHTLAPDPANCFNLPLKIHWTWSRLAGGIYWKVS